NWATPRLQCVGGIFAFSRVPTARGTGRQNRPGSAQRQRGGRSEPYLPTDAGEARLRSGAGAKCTAVAKRNTPICRRSDERGLPLVKFERPNEVLDPLVDSETRLPQGPVWLCRIGTDGLAYEIAGRIVRPGRKYILLSEEELPRDQSLFAACGLDCDGISATL